MSHSVVGSGTVGYWDVKRCCNLQVSCHGLSYGKTTTTGPPLPQRATTAWVGASSRKEVREVVKEMAACCQKRKRRWWKKAMGKIQSLKCQSVPPKKQRVILLTRAKGVISNTVSSLYLPSWELISFHPALWKMIILLLTKVGDISALVPWRVSKIPALCRPKLELMWKAIEWHVWTVLYILR